MGETHTFCLLIRCTEKNTWLLPKMQNPNLLGRETAHEGMLRGIPASG